jgi:hypothetical protein
MTTALASSWWVLPLLLPLGCVLGAEPQPLLVRLAGLVEAAPLLLNPLSAAACLPASRCPAALERGHVEDLPAQQVAGGHRQ